jgi:hypothetical protein
MLNYSDTRHKLFLREYIELICRYYPDLDRKELCVCMGFCSAVWDTHYNTLYDIVVEYSLRKKRAGICK